jgi:hypothetical protein
VWFQTSRPISSVQVISNNGYISLPTQLLVSGDRVTLPTDHWLVEGYCERSEMNDAIVRDTPSATQLDRVLSQPRPTASVCVSDAYGNGPSSVKEDWCHWAGEVSAGRVKGRTIKWSSKNKGREQLSIQWELGIRDDGYVPGQVTRNIGLVQDLHLQGQVPE